MSNELKKEQVKKPGSQRLYEEIATAFRERHYNFFWSDVFSAKTTSFESENIIINRFINGMKNLGGPFGKAIIGLADKLEQPCVTKIEDESGLAPMEKKGKYYFSKRVDKAIDILYQEMETGQYTPLEHLGDVEYMCSHHSAFINTIVGLFGNELAKKILGLAYVSANIDSYNKLIQDMRIQRKNRTNYIFENGKLSKKDSDLLNFYISSSWHIIFANATKDYTQETLNRDFDGTLICECIHNRAKEALYEIVCDNKFATFHEPLGKVSTFEECKTSFPGIHSRVLDSVGMTKLLSEIIEDSYKVRSQRINESIRIYEGIGWRNINTPSGYSKAIDAGKKIIDNTINYYTDIMGRLVDHMNYRHGISGLVVEHTILNLLRGHFLITPYIEKDSNNKYSIKPGPETETALINGAHSVYEVIQKHISQDVLDKLREKEEIIRFTDDTSLTGAITITCGMYLNGRTGVTGLYKMPNGLMREIKPEEALVKIATGISIGSLYKDEPGQEIRKKAKKMEGN